MKETEYAAVNPLLTALVPRVRDALGNAFVGAYLFGSLVYGDFDPEISDVDVLVAVTEPLDSGQFTRLGAVHDALVADFPAWTNRIEILYASLAHLRTFKTRATPIAVISPGEPFNVKEAGVEWLINWYQVQEQGWKLAGPAPETLIEPVSAAEFRQWIRDRVPGWREEVRGTHASRTAQSYYMLTMCRALYAYEHGTQASKRAAAAWAAGQFPAWASLLDDALRWRADPGESTRDADPATYAATAGFIERILARIEGQGTTLTGAL